MRVLIAEDQDIIRMGLCKIVGELKDLEIEDASDGGSAWAAFCERPADMLITDIVMPDMDGLKLLERVYAVAPECTLVVVSGYDKFDYAQQAMRFGVKDYLLKPIRREPLNMCVERCRAELKLRRERQTSRLLDAWRAALNGQEQLALSLAADALPHEPDSLLVSINRRGGTREAELPLLFPLCAPEDALKLYLMRGLTPPKAPHMSGLFAERLGDRPEQAFLKLTQAISAGNLNSHALKRAVKYIDENYADGLSLGKVAGVVHMHPNYLSSLFKRRMGSGFSNYLQHVRIDKARHYLSQTDLKIYEVAKLCGFGDERYFARVFRRVCGESPQEYRSKLH